MASETQLRPPPFSGATMWPPDDTEESILGTDLHQMTISNLRLGINELARSRRTRDEPLPWQALSQITLLGCVHPDGTDFTTYLDIFVHPHPISQNRGSVALVTDGPPVLIIEVLSESTYRWDFDLERGKGYSYAQAGVREYLALDPTGAFVAEGGRGWRLVDGTYRPWEQEANGRWQSEQIAVAIGLEGVLAAAYSPEGGGSCARVRSRRSWPDGMQS